MIEMIERNKKRIAISVIAIAIIGILVLSSVGLLQMRWEETGEETGSSFIVTITAYKDGVPVEDPTTMSGYTRGDVEIDSFVVTIDWTVTGTNVEWSTLNVAGKLEVDFLNKYDNYINEYTITFNSGEAVSSWTKTLVCGVDLCKAENIVYGGWFLEFRTGLSVTADDTIGNPLSDTVPDLVGTIFIEYSSDLGFEGAGMDY